MISIKQLGRYKLIETKKHNKILYLDNDVYAWVEPAGIGNLLVVSHKAHRSDYTISVGRYRLYDVIDEPALSDQPHLELEVGSDIWQGYLLLTGLPDDRKSRGRMIPTYEKIPLAQTAARARGYGVLSSRR